MIQGESSMVQKALACPHTCLEETGPKCQPGLKGLLQKIWDATQTPVGF